MSTGQERVRKEDPLALFVEGFRVLLKDVGIRPVSPEVEVEVETLGEEHIIRGEN